MTFYCNNGKWRDEFGRDVPTVPVQQFPSDKRMPRAFAEEGYKEYTAQYGTSQSLDRLCERGGFSTIELIQLLVERIKRLESEVSDGK